MSLLTKTPIRYSLIAIIFVILMFFLIILLDKNPVIYISNIVFLGPLLGAFLFLSVKSFKDTNIGGLRFWQGFSVGLIYIVSFASLYMLLLFLYSNFGSQSYFDEYRQISVDRVELQKELILDSYNEQAYNDALETASSESNLSIILRLVRNCIIIGIILLPIPALFMRTPDTQQPKKQ